MTINPNEIVIPLVNECTRTMGDTLKCVIMYGDALSHEFIPGKSTISLLFLLDPCRYAEIERITAILPARLKNVSISPMFLSPGMLKDSSTLFPVEILTIQRAYRVLHGDDLLNEINICKDRLLEQCRRELSGLLLHLSSENAIQRYSNRLLSKKLSDILSSLVPVFSALLKVYDIKIPHATSEIIASVEDLHSFGPSVLSEIYLKEIRTTITEAYAVLYDIIKTIYDETDLIRIDDQENIPQENELII